MRHKDLTKLTKDQREKFLAYRREYYARTRERYCERKRNQIARRKAEKAGAVVVATNARKAKRGDITQKQHPNLVRKEASS
jgi:hypothetical protein